jgi:hypothetical protein
VAIWTYESILFPDNILALVGISIWEALNGAGVTTEKAVEIGADLVALTLTESMALSASGLEEVGTLLGVACGRGIVSGVPVSICSQEMILQLHALQSCE